MHLFTLKKVNCSFICKLVPEIACNIYPPLDGGRLFSSCLVYEKVARLQSSQVCTVPQNLSFLLLWLLLLLITMQFHPLLVTIWFHPLCNGSSALLAVMGQLRELNCPEILQSSLLVGLGGCQF